MLKVAIVAEYALAEKVVQAMEHHHFGQKVEQLTTVTFKPFDEDKDLRFHKKAVPEVLVEDVVWSEFDYVLFAATLEQAPVIAKAADEGCIVIDMLGVCANLQDIPLVVPSINDEQIEHIRYRNIVALPDAQVTQAALALDSLVKSQSIQQVVITSLLPASYVNEECVTELVGQTARLLNGVPLEEDQQRLAFDVFPKYKLSVPTQLQRIFPELNNVIFHQVQVPVFYGLAQMITVNFDLDVTLSLKHLWEDEEMFDVQLQKLVTPVSNGLAENEEESAKLHICQIQEHLRGIEFWSIADEQRFDIAKMTLELAERVTTSL
ncbi:aspartate-semialdehyde dehydrogenase [Actinobacillus delphinicola]|uniref:oxidoreductase n=1 Tax=Actinobacillus delphinicola TaxID=51161 RepID=UPI002441CAB1|nr:oxidoreductase [Actinobacillus delphinicola]MDG6896753.1 aspartate-semialdehyde dehydrogenase [Actinobacillus delphinicola]